MKSLPLFFAGFLLGGLIVPWYIAQHTQVVQADTADGLSVVTFANGVTKVAYHDYDYAHPEAAGWTIRAEIPAIENPNHSESFLSAEQYISPSFVHQGGEHPWDHDVYVFDDTEMQGCARNVLYVDRVARTMTTRQLGYCVTQSIDDTATMFFGKSINGEEAVVGLYADGSVLHGTTVTADTRLAAAKADGDKMLMFSGDCNPSEDTIRLLLWDVAGGTVEDVRSQLYGVNCVYVDTAMYSEKLDQFDIFSNGTRVGSVR